MVEYTVADRAWAPSYIGLGAQKSASSWLNLCLLEHPEIEGPSRKEIHFFDLGSNFKRGVDYYRTFFPDDSTAVSGEITPAYLYTPEVPQRIHSCFPDVKLLVCLRNPIDRAWSHFQYGTRMNGRLSVYDSFSEAFRTDRSLADNGRYGEQLERYLQYFSSDQIHVLFYEDVQSDPIDTIQSVYRFLELEQADFIPSSIQLRLNQTGDRERNIKFKSLWQILLRFRRKLHEYPSVDNLLTKTGLMSKFKKIVIRTTKVKRRSGGAETLPRPVMSAADRQLVAATLAEDLCKLETLTGRDLTQWKQIS